MAASVDDETLYPTLLGWLIADGSIDLKIETVAIGVAARPAQLGDPNGGKCIVGVWHARSYLTPQYTPHYVLDVVGSL